MTERRNPTRLEQERIERQAFFPLYDECALRVAELKAQEPMTVADYEAMRDGANASIYDADFDPDEDRWSE